MHFFCWGSAIWNSPSYASKVNEPPPPKKKIAFWNLGIWWCGKYGNCNYDFVVSLLDPLSSIFVTNTCNIGSYYINLKTEKHVYSFDLIELFWLAGQCAVETCISRQTRHTRSITTVSHLMTETDTVYKTCSGWNSRSVSHSLYHCMLPLTFINSYVKIGVLTLQRLYTKWNY